MIKSPYKVKYKALRVHDSRSPPLDCSRSIKSNWRWSRKDKYGSIYLCLDKGAMRAELSKMVKKRGFSVDYLFLFSISEVEALLESVLDLTDPKTREDYNIELSDITSDEQKSQERCREVADKARSQDFEAILSPSSADPSGKNLAIYPDKLKKSSSLKVLKTEGLVRI